jgi:hypothetical protein
MEIRRIEGRILTTLRTKSVRASGVLMCGLALGLRHLPAAGLALAGYSSVVLSPAPTWVGAPRRAAHPAGEDRS